MPTLAGHRLQGDDGVDGSSLRYLLGIILEEKKQEEERRKEEEKEKEKAARTSASSASKRTRKKRKKRRLPRGVRIRRCGQGSRSSTGLRCPASWPVCTRRTVAVACTRLVLMVTMHLALCFFPSSCPYAPHHGRHAPEGQLPKVYRKIELWEMTR